MKRQNKHSVGTRLILLALSFVALTLTSTHIVREPTTLSATMAIYIGFGWMALFATMFAGASKTNI